LDAAATEELLTTQSTDVVYIRDGAKQIAVILRRHYVREGITFLTPDDYSQQLGYMNRPAGYRIPPHVHNPVPREVVFTKEVLIVKSGKARVDFYDDDRNYLESRYLNAGDVILLASGGHGFEMLEATEMIEVKQGPYAGDGDKTRFEGVASEQIRIRE
jgi:mannose-6-phosphate isomerase-like protein (cupin superfamily)